MWNRITDRDRQDTSLPTTGFSASELRDFIKNDLKAFDWELFRGTKLDGVNSAMMDHLDADKDGTVTWEEFSAVEGQILEQLAPERGGPEQAVQSALGKFDETDTNGDGQLSYSELYDATMASLRSEEASTGEDVEHKDVKAQFGSLLLLEALDLDEHGTTPKKRTISREELEQNVREIAEKKPSDSA